jgi:tRNA (mo5U34)-methyltransferase
VLVSLKKLSGSDPFANKATKVSRHFGRHVDDDLRAQEKGNWHMSTGDLPKGAVDIRWFHSIDLGNGVVTAGRRPIAELKIQADAVFRDGVSGLSVLDVGAWDGYFSFEAKRRGAARVKATDHFCWSGAGWGTKAGFEFARDVTKLDIEDQEIDVPQISLETVGSWDVVLFLGVFYHLKNPFDALERVASVTNKRLIVESHVETQLSPERPAMMFYPGAELGGDPTNWWGPNPSCIIEMLRTCGFEHVDYSVWRGTRGIFRAHR